MEGRVTQFHDNEKREARGHVALFSLSGSLRGSVDQFAGVGEVGVTQFSGKEMAGEGHTLFIRIPDFHFTNPLPLTSFESLPN